MLQLLVRQYESTLGMPADMQWIPSTFYILLFVQGLTVTRYRDEEIQDPDNIDPRSDAEIDHGPAAGLGCRNGFPSLLISFLTLSLGRE